MKLPSDNLNYPIKLLIGNSSGSAFLIKNKNELYLVSAKHVLYIQDQITKERKLLDNNLRVVCYPRLSTGIAKIPRIYNLDLKKIATDGNLKPHPEVDIVVIKIGNLVQDTVGMRISFVDGIVVEQDSAGGLVWYDIVTARKFEEVEVTNDVFVLGYPVSIGDGTINQIDYNSSLAKRGIVAGKNSYRKTIILDCSVYGGNSGGMVLELNNGTIHLIGVVVEFVPFVDQWQNIKFPSLYNTNLHNSGYSVVIPVDFIYDLMDQIKKTI